MQDNIKNQWFEITKCALIMYRLTFGENSISDEFFNRYTNEVYNKLTSLQLSDLDEPTIDKIFDVKPEDKATAARFLAAVVLMIRAYRTMQSGHPDFRTKGVGFKWDQVPTKERAMEVETKCRERHGFDEVGGMPIHAVVSAIFESFKSGDAPSAETCINRIKEKGAVIISEEDTKNAQLRLMKLLLILCEIEQERMGV